MAVVQSAYGGVDFTLEPSGNKVYYVDSGPPTAGTYVAGDLAIIAPVSNNGVAGIAPTVLQPLGFRCTTGGTPGTWVSLGGVSTSLGAAVSSATSITPTGSVFHVTGTTTVNTIVATGFQSGDQITIIPDGVFTLGTSGNIALGGTSVVSKALIMTWDATAVKWYMSYVA